jgi:hypothetical protein
MVGIGHVREEKKAEANECKANMHALDPSVAKPSVNSAKIGRSCGVTPALPLAGLY